MPGRRTTGGAATIVGVIFLLVGLLASPAAAEKHHPTSSSSTTTSTIKTSSTSGTRPSTTSTTDPKSPTTTVPDTTTSSSSTTTVPDTTTSSSSTTTVPDTTTSSSTTVPDTTTSSSSTTTVPDTTTSSSTTVPDTTTSSSVPAEPGYVIEAVQECEATVRVWAGGPAGPATVRLTSADVEVDADVELLGGPDRLVELEFPVNPSTPALVVLIVRGDVVADFELADSDFCRSGSGAPPPELPRTGAPAEILLAAGALLVLAGRLILRRVSTG